jgi:drug/metabolite transporter (DMT)-like permease
MNYVSWIGVLFIVLGLAGLIYGGITYNSTSNVVDMGSVRLRVEEKQKIPLSPVGGALSVLLGALMLGSGKRRRHSGQKN